MGGASTVISAPTMAELETKVREWYAEAATRGLEEERHPWDPKDAHKSNGEYEFIVWAHT